MADHTARILDFGIAKLTRDGSSVAKGDSPPPRTHVPDLSEALQGVILKGMATDPADRYGNIEEYAHSRLPFAAPQIRDLWTSAI